MNELSFDARNCFFTLYIYVKMPVYVLDMLLLVHISIFIYSVLDVFLSLVSQISRFLLFPLVLSKIL